MSHLSMASSSSHVRNPPRKFLVFISFRGEDTRDNFVSHLFKSLEGKGIDTFKDDKKIKKGVSVDTELFEAIQHSKLAIVVLSENFAYSTWCLEELSKILECRKLGQIVVPIFYKVDPSDVRHLRGSFAKAFAKHEKRFNREIENVKKWKKALKKVANISGHNSKGRDESRLIEEITYDISHKILNTRNLSMQSVASDFVGMGPIMEEINRLLELGSNDVRMLGIWGMGGIGKTTIAKVAYHRISNQFEACCFLDKVKMKLDKSDQSVVRLQEELLYKISKTSKISLDTDIEGRKQIEDRCSHRKVLIVVDDVDDSKQLKGLVKSCDWFGPGSRIIITTRDRHLLLEHEVKHIYEAQKLHDGDALQLFCQCAFKTEQPTSELQDLSKQIVSYCQGLPLALEVLGSSMVSRSKDEWEAKIQKLQSGLDQNIQKVLESSYDGLDNSQKALFLDIACFFIGWQKVLVEKIFSAIDIRTLVDRSLISMEKYDRAGVICMHDLLQEMGRGIVRQNSKGKLEDQSHLFDVEDVYNLFTRNMGADEAKATSLHLDEIKDGWKDIHAYRTLFPSSLKYLYWNGCPLSRSLSKSSFENLVVFKILRSPVEQLWKGVKPLPNLKILELHWCQNLRRIPNLGGAPNLEKLILRFCSNLVEGHWSVGDLNNLKEVDLLCCVKLKDFRWLNGDKASHRTHSRLGALKFSKFPQTSEKTKCLTMLILDGTSIKELPSAITDLQSLKSLRLMVCRRLESLTGNICKLKSLQSMTLYGCSKLSFFPEVSETMPKLRYLDLGETGITTLPNSICKLQSLESLGLYRCSKFAILPESIGALTSLQSIYLGRTAIRSLPSIEGYYSNLTKVEECDRILQRLRGSLRNSLPRYREILRNHRSRFDSVTNVFQRLSNSESHLDRMFAELEAIFNQLPSPWQPIDFFLRRDIGGNGLCSVRMCSTLFPYQQTSLSFNCGNLCELLKMNGMFQFTRSHNGLVSVSGRTRELSWEFKEKFRKIYEIIVDLVDSSAFESWRLECREKKAVFDNTPYGLRDAALDELIDCVSQTSHYQTKEGIVLSYFYSLE